MSSIGGVPLAMLVGRRIRIYTDRKRREFVEGVLRHEGEHFTILDPKHPPCRWIVNAPGRVLELAP